MKISQANPGDTLRTPNGRHLVVGHNLTVKTELGGYFYYPGMYDEEMEQVFPLVVSEGTSYKPALVFGNPTMGFKHPVKLILVEEAGPCQGYRHQFQISDYGCRVLFQSKSNDQRVGAFIADWHCRSGQLWLRVERALACCFEWKDKTPVMRLGFGTSWITVPAQ